MTSVQLDATATINRDKLVAFDLETTGPLPATARVVSAALIRVTGADINATSWLADPEVEIPAEATAVHGITTEHARANGQVHADVIAEVIAGIREAWANGYTLVVYNAAYDLTILRRFDPSFEIDGPVLDPFVIDRAVDPYRKGKRTLGAVCEHHGVRLDDAHEASADALAAARLAWRFAEHDTLQGLPWNDVNNKQASWYADRQTNFRAYLQRKGESGDDVNTQWPMQQFGPAA